MNVPVTVESPVDDIGEAVKVEAAGDVEPAIVELGVVAVAAVPGFWAAEVVYFVQHSLKLLCMAG